MTTVADTSLACRSERRLVRIKRVSGFSLDLRELWAYHELLYFFVWRDVKVRYKQTTLGIAWAIIQPFTSMVLFSAIFGGLAGIKGGDGVPYPLFVYAGLLPWQYFSSCLTGSGLAILGSSSLVTKVYFPRLLLPLASVATPIVDFLFAFAIFAGMFIWYGWVPSWHAIAIPGLLLLALLSAFGVGLWLSALNVRYRDVRYVIPYLVQVWLYVTPVIYPSSLVPDRFRWLLSLNPMSGVIEGFRWSALGSGTVHPFELVLSVVVGAVLVMSGVWYFRRVERRFADVI